MKSAEIGTLPPFPHHLTNESTVRSAAGVRKLTRVRKGSGVSFKKLREQVVCALVEACL